MVLGEDGPPVVVRLPGQAREEAPGRPASSGSGATPVASRMVEEVDQGEGVATVLPAGTSGPAMSSGTRRPRT